MVARRASRFDVRYAEILRLSAARASIAAFADLKLCEISREKIQLFLNAKLAQGLAWGTVHHLQWALSKIISAAVEWGYLEANPVRLTKLPRRRRAAAKAALNGGQIIRLLMVLQEPVRSLVFLLTVTGLRIGEALALRWRNVEFAGGLLRIEESVYDGHFDDPKSKRSRRVIPFGPRLLALLARRRAQTIGGPEDLLFATARGTPLDRHTMLSRHLKPAAHALGLSGLSWHALRHANATLHDSLGTPLGTVQALLGHSSSEVTRQIYVHAVPEDQQRAAERLEEAVFGPKSDPNVEPKELPFPQVIEEIGRGEEI